MEADHGQYDRDEEVFGVTGTCILFRTKMLGEVGLFWQPLKMYLDEVELFIRARKSGWKVLYTGETEVGHKYMQSTAQNKLLQVEKQTKRNWLLIALRHYPWKSKLAMVRNYLFNV
jgi:GT2 family glycosyltransferase